VEYIDSYGDAASEYTYTEEYSTDIDIEVPLNVADWDYLEVAAVTPAIASKVRITCYISYYQSTNGS
jgi:hypothetical protein